VTESIPDAGEGSALDQTIIVLVEPQDPINIGNTIRAMKNMGLTRLRLVRPANADGAAVRISAPKADDVIAAMEIFETVEAALADCVLVVAMTARGRRHRRVALRPPEAAELLVERAAMGPVAVVFGREDSGLPNDVVDAAHRVCTIGTRPDYSSLNLGQAVLVICYEVFALAGKPEPLKGPQRSHPPATVAEVDGMLGQIGSTLETIGFYKSGHPGAIPATLRQVMLRADLDRRETSLLRGIFVEIVAFARRASASK
jgi:TrmH family RNA methyltransferase